MKKKIASCLLVLLCVCMLQTGCKPKDTTTSSGTNSEQTGEFESIPSDNGTESEETEDPTASEEQSASTSGTSSKSSVNSNQTTTKPSASGQDIWKKYSPAITLKMVRSTDDIIENTLNQLGETIGSNRWLKLYQDKLGVNIKYDWVAKGNDGYATKLNLSIASKQLPDVFSVTPLQMQQLAAAGLIEDLTTVYVPYALSDQSKIEADDYGWGNRLPPKDYQEYFRYISSFARMIADIFPAEEYRQWQFRIGTEPDNFHWWTGTEEEYYKLYDYSVAALQKELGAEHLDVSLGNLENYTKWPNMLAHCANGKNYYTGEIGTQVNRFSISHYQLGTESLPYWEFPRILAETLQRIKEYPQLGITKINVGEGQFLSDGMSPPHRLSNAQDGTEYGASWMAEMYHACCANGCEYFANWAYHCDFWLTDQPMLKVPAYHVAQMIKNMSGCSSVAVRSGEAEKKGNTIGAIAAVDPLKKHLQVMVYNHNLERENIAEDLEICITADSQSDSVSVKAWLVDETHSNFFRRWLQDSAHIKRNESSADFDTLGSLVDTEVANLLEDDALEFWTAQKQKYAQLDGLEEISLPFSIKNHVIRIPYTLSGHGVLFLSIMYL